MPDACKISLNRYKYLEGSFFWNWSSILHTISMFCCNTCESWCPSFCIRRFKGIYLRSTLYESKKGHWHIPIISEVGNEDQRTWLRITRANSSLAEGLDGGSHSWCSYYFSNEVKISLCFFFTCLYKWLTPYCCL